MASACETWLGLAGASVLLPYPDSCDVDYLRTGTYRRMADGTLKFDYSASAQKRWRITWNLLSGTDFTTVETEAQRAASMVFTPLTTSASFNVLTPTFRATPVPMAGDNLFWNVDLVVETLDE